MILWDNGDCWRVDARLSSYTINHSSSFNENSKRPKTKTKKKTTTMTHHQKMVWNIWRGINNSAKNTLTTTFYAASIKHHWWLYEISWNAFGSESQIMYAVTRKKALVMQLLNGRNISFRPMNWMTSTKIHSVVNLNSVRLVVLVIKQSKNEVACDWWLCNKKVKTEQWKT